MSSVCVNKSHDEGQFGVSLYYYRSLHVGIVFTIDTMHIYIYKYIYLSLYVLCVCACVCVRVCICVIKVCKNVHIL